MLLNQPESGIDLPHAQTVVSRQFDSRFQSELRFTSGRVYVDVHASLFAREEIKAKGTFPENGRAHQVALYPSRRKIRPLLDVPAALDLDKDVHQLLGWNIRFSNCVDFSDTGPDW